MSPRNSMKNNAARSAIGMENLYARFLCRRLSFFAVYLIGKTSKLLHKAAQFRGKFAVIKVSKQAD